MHRDDLAPKNLSSSEIDSRAKCCVCPHWNGSGRNCRLITDGLFLPVEQHINAYCLSGLYPACSHFQRLAGGTDISEQPLPHPINRRRSIRIPQHHLFRFSEITGSDQISGLREDDAWTVDLSDHGIRFATRQFLPPGTLLEYHLGTTTHLNGIDGAGRVIWSEPLANTALFHVGIAFSAALIPANYTPPNS